MALDGTLAGLKASIGDWLNRSDLTAGIADFVVMATAQISRRLIAGGPVIQMLGTWSPTISAELTNLPSDFMGVRSIYLSGGSSTARKVEFVEPEKIAERKQLYPTYSGDPEIYSIVGSQIQFWPWNGQTYAATVLYWQALPALTSGSVNWVLTMHPDLYLYTALIQSAPYLRDDDRITMWAQAASTILDDVIAADRNVSQAPHMAAPLLTAGHP